MKPLIIFGLEDFADIAYEYFTFDSDYTVVGFAAHRRYVTEKTKFGLPVFAFENITDFLNPSHHSIFIAVTYRQMNLLRKQILRDAIKLGFAPASYISSRSFVWKNVKVGDHCFIFENNTIQPFCEIGINSILWSGNHIGHHSRIGNNVFISSQVVISGWVEIGDNCFLGVNSTYANGVKIGESSWINAHSLVNSDVTSLQFVVQPESERKTLDVSRLEKRLSQKSLDR